MHSSFPNVTNDDGLYCCKQLLPANRELLQLVQERNWIPLLLGWLNLHDRPAVQVEALLALTNIAELCAQQSIYQHTQAQSSAAAAAAAAAQAAAAAAVKVAGSNLPASVAGASSAMPPIYSFPTGGDGVNPKNNAGSYPYSSLVPPTPGSVPFPPLSFSQTLSPEALAAFDASLTSTLQQSKALSAACKNLKQPGNTTNTSSIGLPAFSPTALQNSIPTPSSALTGGVSLPSALTGSQGGGSSSSNTSFLPPPTPIAGQGTSSSSFPQQLSASSQHLLLRHADAIPTLISLLSSPNKEVYEQAMWILGSIAAGDSTGTGTTGSNGNGSSTDGVREKSVAARDVILAAGIMNQLLRCLEMHPTNLSLQRIGSWTLSNLVEGIFQQPSSGRSGSKTEYSSSDEIEMHTLLPVLRRLLRMADVEVLSYTCWTLSHLCDGPSSHISAVVTSRDPKSPRGGLVPRLVELLGHSSWRVTKPALRTIGNIVCAECSDDNNHGSSPPTDYTEIILDCNAVPKLKDLVTHSNREIQKEACWTLSNIAAGTVDQIQAVIDSQAIAPLVKLVSDKNTDQEVRSEACWVVLNATSCGSDSQIEILVDEGCVSVLGVLLGEASMVMMALEGLERVLQVEEARESARCDDDDEKTPTLVSASLIEKALDKHNSSAVTKRATRIWKQHFVSCALCKKSFSKHRTADATFCDECKCYVCCNCDCKIYHLSYQEELWAESEEKTEAKKNAKKSKKAKKKQKQKQKKAEQLTQPQQDEDPDHVGDGKETNSDVSEEEIQGNSLQKEEKLKKKEQGTKRSNKALSKDTKSGPSNGNNPGFPKELESEAEQQPPVDFVLYLQQTGSIIALAKLMDSLEYGEGNIDGDFDEAELKLIRQRQVLNDPAAN